MATVQIIDNKGGVNSHPVTIPKFAGTSVTVAATTTSRAFHAIVTWAAANEGGADVLTLDGSGNVLTFLTF